MESSLPTLEWLTNHDLLPYLSKSEDYPFITPAQVLISLSFITFLNVFEHYLIKIKQFNLKDSARIVSWVFSIVSSLTTIIILILNHSNQDSSHIWNPRRSYCEVIPYVEYLTTLAWSFFIWDTSICIIRGWSVPFVIHGIICSILYFQPMTTPVLHRLALYFLLYELSTVFLNGFQFCDLLGYPALSRVLSIVFVISFFLIRIVFGSWLSWEVWEIFVFGNQNNVDTHCYPAWLVGLTLFSNAAFYGLNLYWFVKIVEGALKRGHKTKTG